MPETLHLAVVFLGWCPLRRLTLASLLESGKQMTCHVNHTQSKGDSKMLRKLVVLTVVGTVVSVSGTAQAEGWSWTSLGKPSGCVSPEVYDPIGRLLVGAAAIEARVWTGEIDPEERAGRHLDNARNATRLPFASGKLGRHDLFRKYIQPLWVR